MASSSNKVKKETPKPVLTKKRRRSFMLITLLLPVMLLIVLEIVLRAVQYGSEYDLVKGTTVNGKEFYYINPAVGRRYFDPERYFVPQVYSGNFEKVKAGNTYRVFVLGESTPAGFPYQYNATPAQILKKQLELLFPEMNIEVVNAGLTGTNSYTVLEFIDELVHYQPDAFIVYSGQNEFYGAFGVASTNSIGSERWLIRLYQSLRKVRTFVLAEHSLNSLSRLLFAPNSSAYSGTLMQQLANDKAIPLHSRQYEKALSAFERNITETVMIASENNVPVILSTLVTNEGNLPPFVSLHAGSLSNDNRKEMEAKLDSGFALEKSGQFRGAIDRYLNIAALDSMWAIVHYRLGHCYERMGNLDSALGAYGKARDHDGLRFRASADFNNAIHRIASLQKAGIADVESTFRAHSPNRIIGASLLWEHVHPTFTGYVLLARSWLEGLKNSTSLPSTGQVLSSTMIPDSILVDKMKVTALDLEIGALTMHGLLRRWPFTTEPYVEMLPQNAVQRVARMFIKGELRWNEAHYEMADMYLKENDGMNALNEYLSVTEMYPTDPFPLMRIGDLFSAVQENEQAAKAYAQSLTLQENSFIRLKLGILSLKAQQYIEAAEQLSKAMHTGNNQSQVLLTPSQFDDAQFYFALALFKSGKTDQAKAVLTSMLQEDPNNSKALRLSKEVDAFRSMNK